ncbi:putative rhodopsin orphan GPCR [Fasciola gigantica]|uniref:Putative rhodopsin orphan GPCR n=1 Tax=Fasciola gigantica TaxID=46835 RepID=A0A504Z3B5_FASGI|nr:putative rhodopsin orphan GPCR [Fasciola gigantica]
MSIIHELDLPNTSSMTLANQTNTSENTRNGQGSLRPTLLMLIACIGLIGNLLNLIVLRSYHTTQITHGGECTARVNLLGLALADFFVCLTSLPLGYVKRSHESVTFMLLYTIVGPGLVTYFLAVSVWMVLLMSVVRYVAVCRPLTSRAWLTSRHMCHVIVMIYALGFLFHIPSFSMYTYDEEQEWSVVDSVQCDLSNVTSYSGPKSCAHPTVLVVYERPFWRSETVDVTHHVIHILFTNIAPFIGVVVSNIAVIRACHRSDQCRREGHVSKPTVTGRSSHIKSSPSHRVVLKTNLPTEGVHSDPLVPGTPRPMAAWSVHNMRSIPGPFATSVTNRYPPTATNRVTPLLLAVIVAFLLFTAPFGIVHFVCLRLMRKLGVRVRDNKQARRLYMALNSTVEWTNVVQLFSCASNFFLYFLVSTIFRRTTRRTCRHVYKHVSSCHRRACISFISLFHSTGDSEKWVPNNQVQSLCHVLDPKMVPRTVTAKSLPEEQCRNLDFVPMADLVKSKCAHDQLSRERCCCDPCPLSVKFNGPYTTPCLYNGASNSTMLQASEVPVPREGGEPVDRAIHYWPHYFAPSWSETAFCSEPQCCVIRSSICAGRACLCSGCKLTPSDSASAQKE